MKKLGFVLLLCLTNLTFGQVRVNLNGVLSVTFPSKPTRTKTDSNTTVYSANLNTAYYLVTVKDLHKKSNFALYNDSLENLYTDVVNTTVKKLSAKLVDKQYITINDAKAVTFEYTLSGKATLPDTRFQQSVYLDKWLISISFWTFKDKLLLNTGNKDIFFKSITKPNDEQPQATYNTAKTDSATAGKVTIDEGKSGYINATKSSTWYVTWFAILAVVIVGLLFIKRRIRNNK